MLIEYCNGVYFIPFNESKDVVCSIVENRVNSFIDKKVRDDILVNYAKFLEIDLHNGTSVNLVEITVRDRVEIQFSSIEFFDVFAFNSFRSLNYEFVDYLKRNSGSSEVKQYRNMVNYYSLLTEEFNSIGSFLQNMEIPKPVAISVMVRTVDNKYIVTKRPMHLAIGAGLASVSSTGALEVEDFRSSNPFFNCASRELFEELGIEVSHENMNILGIAIGENKMQPVVVIDAMASIASGDVFNNLKNATDYKLEISNLYVLNREELKVFLLSNKFTEVGRFHIDSQLNK